MPWFDVKLRKEYQDEEGQDQVGEFGAQMLAPDEKTAVAAARALHSGEPDLELVSVVLV